MVPTLATIPEYFFQLQWKVSYDSLFSVWHQIIPGVDVCRIGKWFLHVAAEASAHFLMLFKAAWTETERWSAWPLQTSGIQPAAGATWDGARGFVDYCPGVRLVPGICWGGSLQFFRVPDAQLRNKHRVPGTALHAGARLGHQHVQRCLWMSRPEGNWTKCTLQIIAQ